MRIVFLLFLLSPYLLYSARSEEHSFFRKHPYLFKRDKPYVGNDFKGQLGNHLFQAASAISLAIDHQCRFVYFDTQYREVFWRFNLRGPENLTHLRRNCHSYYSRMDDKLGFDFTHLYAPIKFRPNMIMCGFFENYHYFDHHRKDIQEAFSPRRKKLRELKSKHPIIFESENSVGLHIRTFYHDIEGRDKKLIYSKLPAPNLHYIKEAISHFPPDTLFVVCTDRIEWTKRFLSQIDANFYYPNDSLTNDFYCLSLCKHNIISNSTFSWWAAYLNKNPHKKVIVPVPYSFNSRRSDDDIYLAEWIRIKRVEDGKIPSFNTHIIFEGDSDG